MAVTIKLCLMASAGGGGRVEGKCSFKNRCRTWRNIFAGGLRGSDSVKRVCQRRKREVQEACGEAAGAEGQCQAGGAKLFSFPNTSHKLRRITGEINQPLWIIYIYLYLKRTKRDSELRRRESYGANMVTASEQAVPVRTYCICLGHKWTESSQTQHSKVSGWISYWELGIG